MKKYIVLIVSLLLLLTGCATFENDLTINKDKSVDYTMKLLLDKEFLSIAGKQGTEEMWKEIKREANDKGFKTKDINKNGQKGIIIKKSFKELSDLEDLNSKEEQIDVEVKHRIIYDDINVSITRPASSNEYEDIVDYNFTVNLPYKAIKTNADETKNDKKSLKWYVNPSKEMNIHFTYYHYNWVNIGIVGFFIFLTLLSIKKSKQKHKGKNFDK